MTPTWLAALLAIGSLLAFVYFTADLAVLLRGSKSVPPAVLRLARAGDRRIDMRGPPDVLMTGGAAILFFGIPAMWLLLRADQLDRLAQTLLTGSVFAAVVWIIVLGTLIQRWDSRSQ